MPRLSVLSLLALGSVINFFFLESVAAKTIEESVKVRLDATLLDTIFREDSDTI